MLCSALLLPENDHSPLITRFEDDPHFAIVSWLTDINLHSDKSETE